ncbi:hypothetical protein LOZ80_38085 [Paenibacillus sp. HWE-109]|uniref:phage adaptor protein n=1 Tax=Paenibacillus sp. HWE-109 TaxID=1306526 RepID=UPI001EDF7B72|nr:hypothetical protein [Paenibacillus sp. HWE-109]UKS27203.1 hypothetical protein LOZ80_38085 [Paenibacillus sp. HWE-109]
MGTSTAGQLIAKGKAENGYNNSGIATDLTWLDFFNDALRDLVDDLNIVDLLPALAFTAGTREVDLPSDYFSLVDLYDGNGTYVCERRNYMQAYPAGYMVMNRGGKYIIDLYNYSNSQSFTGLYQRYAKVLAATTDSPEVPTVGERFLIYYAISKALYNNNQMGQGQEYEQKYEQERLKIRNAAARSRGQ